MNYIFKTSFIRLFKKLDRKKQEQIIDAIEALKLLIEEKQKLESLGLKRLSKNIWEIRSSLKDRILFTFEKDTVSFILIGSHVDIIKYLKNL